MTSSTTTTVYIGDGVHMTLDGAYVTLSGSRTGERPITLRPAVLKRLIRTCLAQLHSLPDEALEPPPPPPRKIPLLITTKTRDEEVAEWEATLRRKAAERRAAAPPRPKAEAQPQPKGVGDLA